MLIFKKSVLLRNIFYNNNIIHFDICSYIYGNGEISLFTTLVVCAWPRWDGGMNGAVFFFPP